MAPGSGILHVIQITASKGSHWNSRCASGGMIRASTNVESTMSPQKNAEVRELSTEELTSVAGGTVLAVAGAVAIGLATNAAYDWLKSPGNVKAWETTLKGIL
jgi:lactobin A/cerein 7B family class IIb bacteriocin